MRKKDWRLLLLPLLLLAGCAAPPASSNSVQTLNAASSEKKDYDFVFVCPIVDNEYWKDCIAGIRKADEELGTNTRVLGPGSGGNFSTELMGYMETAIASSPDGILTYAGLAEMAPLIDEAAGQDIPVLTVDSDAPDSARAAHIGTDLYGLGYQSGKTLVQLTGGSAKVGYLCSTFSAKGEEAVFHAFLDAVSDYDMDVVAKGEGGTDPARAAAAVEAMLAEHPEITAIFCTSSFNITGAARVKKAQGLDGLVLLGLDDVEENLAFVREGVLDALLVQSPYSMGYYGVYLLKEYVDSGELAYDSYDTGVTLVTQENVDTYGGVLRR